MAAADPLDEVDADRPARRVLHLAGVAADDAGQFGGRRSLASQVTTATRMGVWPFSSPTGGRSRRPGDPVLDDVGPAGAKYIAAQCRAAEMQVETMGEVVEMERMSRDE